MHRIGFIGFGGMASNHYRRRIPEERLEKAGVWDIDPKRMEYAKNELGAHLYTSQEDLLSDPTIDLVLVATPNDFHKPIAIDAMRHGKNVISEKPVALSSRELAEMRAEAEKNGVFFTVHQNRRWDEDYLTAREVVREGKLGPVFRIESRVHGSRGVPGDWRKMAEKGGGMILDWGVHLLDQALLFYPDAKIKTVYATTSYITTTEVDDGVTVDMGLDNGVHFIVEVGTSNFIPLPRWVVLGRDGTAVIEDWAMNGKIVCSKGEMEKNVIPVETSAGLTKTMAPRSEDNIETLPLPIQHVDGLHAFYNNVLDVLDGKAESAIKLDEVARVMRLMEAIKKSADEKTVVFFE